MKKNKNRAFTLIELLIALALMSILTTTLMLSYQSSINAYSNIEKISQSDMQERITLSLMIDDLRSAYRKDLFYGKAFNPVLTESEIMQFTSSLSLDTNEQNSLALNRVKYTLRKNTKNELYSLVRSERAYVNVPGQFKEVPTVLLNNVSSILLEFFDSNGLAYSEWNNPLLLPSAVRMQLKTKANEKTKDTKILMLLNQQG